MLMQRWRTSRRMWQGASLRWRQKHSLFPALFLQLPASPAPYSAPPCLFCKNWRILSELDLYFSIWLDGGFGGRGKGGVDWGIEVGYHYHFRCFHPLFPSFPITYEQMSIHTHIRMLIYFASFCYACFSNGKRVLVGMWGWMWNQGGEDTSLGSHFPPPFLLPVHFQTCKLHVGARGMGKTTVVPITSPFPFSPRWCGWCCLLVSWWPPPVSPSSIFLSNLFLFSARLCPHPHPPQPLLCTLLKVQAHLKFYTWAIKWKQ